MNSNKVLLGILGAGVIVTFGGILIKDYFVNHPRNESYHVRESVSREFKAKRGYSVPLNVSSEAAVRLGGSGLEVAALREFIDRHSSNGEWTYQMDTTTGNVGTDAFFKKYGTNFASLIVKFAPIQKDEFSEFEEAKPKVLAGNISDGEYYGIVANQRVRVLKFRANKGQTTAYNRFAIIRGSDRRYELVFSYTDGYDDPDKSFDRLKDMKLE